MLADRQWDMATAAAPITGGRDLANPSVVKVVWNGIHQALYFSRSMIPFVRDADTPRQAPCTGAISGYTRTVLVSCGSW